MFTYLRSLTALAFTLTTSLFVSHSTDWIRQHNVQRLQETRECFRCNLSQANLVGANLARTNLLAADLQGADLRRASLRGAVLEWADLRGANLEGAALTGVNLENASLDEANLQKTDLRESNLKGADLRDVNLSRANLVRALMTLIARTTVLCHTTLLDGTISSRDCQ